MQLVKESGRRSFPLIEALKELALERRCWVCSIPQPGVLFIIGAASSRAWCRARQAQKVIAYMVPVEVPVVELVCVTEDGEQVTLAPRHICLLFRRLRSFSNDITRPYVRALEARGVPHVLVGGRSLHDREEIIALRNALTAIEWPDDELSVFATLRGPLFGLSDEALLAFRQYPGGDGKLQIRRFNPMHAVDRARLVPVAHDVADALALLGRLHTGRNRRPIAQTIGMLLDAVRAHAGIALWPNGEQALANCQRLIEMARAFERGAFSFRAFGEKLEADAESDQVGDAPLVEEGTEGVRVMTVHKAKGLEFPVVILADITANLASASPEIGRASWRGRV